ncbi:MAG: DMT family transporter [Actinomycetota bacterium]|nr:DMT family transporter [Actinomycetota bacterium]
MVRAQAAPQGGALDSSLDRFGARDWGLLAGTALLWGSSFIWIEEALEAFEPGLITLVRVVFGAATLAVFPRARATVPRSDIPAIALLGLLWMAAPLLLFPIAQQWIDSSLAGMLNGAVPIFAALVASIAARALPQRKQVLGLAVGFAGVVTVSWPGLGGARSTALGIALVLLATVFYGISVNLAAPLQRRNGALPVLLRAQLFAIAFSLIPGVLAIGGSEFKTTSFLAMIPLGCLGTGLAFVWMSTLVGRVGAARGSVTIYFVPIVAIVLGAVVRSESIAALALLGTAMVIGGAVLTSRKQEPPATQAQKRPSPAETSAN